MAMFQHYNAHQPQKSKLIIPTLIKMQKKTTVVATCGVDTVLLNKHINHNKNLNYHDLK